MELEFIEGNPEDCGRVLSLPETGDALFLGGRAGNVAVMISDPYVSRVHFVVERRNAAFYFHCLSATSGTYIRVDGCCSVSPGSVFQVGETDFEVIQFQTDGILALASGRVPAVPLFHRMTIGRSPECSVALPDDPEVSTVHAEIKCEGENSWRLHDLQSLNGTWRKIDAEVRLKGGETIKLGRTVMAVRMGDKTSKIAEDSLCRICFEYETAIVMIPCGHLCLCGDCADRLGRQTLRRGPICRTEIQSTLRCFKS